MIRRPPISPLFPSTPLFRPPRPHDGGAVGGADTLVTEADAEDRRRGTKPPHHVCGDPRLAGRARPRGDDDVRRSELLDLRSEEHTSELQSLAYLVCRLLLEK